ncbi:isochorismate synthase [Liquorilactobacillus ghanensis]|uniref:isochorismate synthase n=1 Tax=Liquorilactobacillus ghanensis TaxID=399370 RepID=UPI0039EC424A
MKTILNYQIQVLPKLNVTQIGWLLDHFDPAFVFYDWENATLKLCLGAVAECFPAASQRQNQFVTVEKWYQELKQQLKLKNSGPVPLVVGSFLFDPLQNKSATWSKLARGYFFLPQLTIYQTAEQTVAVSCASDSVTCQQQLLQLQQLLGSAVTTTESVGLINVTETQIAAWQRAVQTAITAIQTKQLEKVVLARMITAGLTTRLTTAEIWQRLAPIKQQNYQFLLKYQEQIFISLTPEKLVEFQPAQIRLDALAGTIERGTQKEQTQLLGQQLLQSTKNRQEHQIVVSAITNRLTQLKLAVKHPTEPQILVTGSVQHLYTPITAKGKFDPLNILARLHPTPALGGQPQQAALEFIRKYEGWERGLFGGPTGWLDFAGKGKFVVAIRSALLNGQRAHLFAGAGIVAASDYHQETIETRNKMQPMLNLLKGKNKYE